MKELGSQHIDLQGRVAELTLRAEAAVGALLKSFPASPEIQSSQLQSLLQVATWFYSGSQQVIDFMLAEAEQVATLVNSIPGVLGCFGVGYPFYAMDQGKKPLEIQTISTFISSLRDSLRREDNVTWQCTACNVLESSSLKVGCSTCARTALKPRALLSALPDLDIIIVVERPEQLHEELIEKTLHTSGFFQSDMEIKSSLTRVESLISALQSGVAPSHHLPIDVHLWSFEDFDKGCKSAVAGVPAKIFTRSMYRGWQNDQINHGFDWVFSLTELGEVKPAMRAHLTEHRQLFSSGVSLGSIDLVEFLTQASRRARELLDIQAINDLLHRRIAAWL